MNHPKLQETYFGKIYLTYFTVIINVHLSAAEAAAVVPLPAEPLHEAQTVRDEVQLVVGEQQVRRHLNVRRARLPRARQAAARRRPRGNAVWSQRRDGRLVTGV